MKERRRGERRGRKRKEKKKERQREEREGKKKARRCQNYELFVSLLAREDTTRLENPRNK